MPNSDDLQKLLDILPTELQQTLQSHPQRESLVEVVLDLGRLPEARFPGSSEYLSEVNVTLEHLQDCIDRIGQFGEDNRAGIEQTLHRISAIRNRRGDIIGLTCRVGRAIYGTISMIQDLVEKGQSILMLGRPGVGKTTALREIARVLADDLEKRVVIIDSSNEIAGDGDIPHPAIGRARRMQVARPELQHQVMIEAVENHMPEVIVIDEIGTELEALAARTIAERGVQLIGTAHGNTIENLMKNPTLSDLVGGIQSVTLGDDEARRRGSQKSVLERKAPPTFEVAVEMSSRQEWIVHEDVSIAVDELLRGRQPNPQLRKVDENGEVSIIQETPSLKRPKLPKGSDRIVEFPKAVPEIAPQEWEFEAAGRFRLYLYGIGRHDVQEVINLMGLPITLVKNLDRADAILVLKSHMRKHSNLLRLSQQHDLPIHVVKSTSASHVMQMLQQIVSQDLTEKDEEDVEISPYGKTGKLDDEHDALEEARLAVEQIVLPMGQPVELLPRSARVRELQQELVNHYQLNSSIFGDEPHCRLRIFPA
jgi:stage III sporulation protein SpoIIIAA